MQHIERVLSRFEFVVKMPMVQNDLQKYDYYKLSEEGSASAIDRKLPFLNY